MELLWDLLLVIVAGIIGGYIGHYLTVRRAKQEDFLPYLRQLHGIISRIMEKTDAEKLRDRQQQWMKAQIEQKMRENAYKDLMNDKNARLYGEISPSLVSLMMFMLSYNSLIEVIRQCARFETVFAEMEKKGLITALKVHHRRLYFPLIEVHSSARYITEETDSIRDKLLTSNEMKDRQNIDELVEGETYEKLQRLNTHNLFHFGSQLEDQLRKRI